MTNAMGLLLPAYFLACLLLGGASNGGFVANFALQISGLAIVLIAVATLPRKPGFHLDPRFRSLVLFSGVIVGLQFVPLPLSVWTSLPGREAIAAELALLGVTPSATFVSLSIHDSLASLAWMLPAACFLAAMWFQLEVPALQIALALIGGTLIAIALGLVQFFGGVDSFAYLYEITNRGLMVGVFANANHMATLLLATLPFLTAVVRSQIVVRESARRELLLLWAVLVGFIVLAIGLVGSLTGYALLLPVLVLCGMMLLPGSRKKLLTALLGAFAIGIGLVSLTDEGGNVFSEDAALSERGRQQIFSVTLEANEEFWPVGTGLGTFRDIYDNYEDRNSVSNVYVNHAHSDYLEVALEMGLAGVAGIVAFLAWWLSRLRAIWVGRATDPFVHAAAIASGTILVHSGWDYPLRTATLSTLFAFCCVLMGQLQLRTIEKNPAKSSDRRSKTSGG
ncbi:O-antigen ligase family protein [Aurantiacibacter hainanensis]|uniref:O-antigen ligase family protein n=1 Tax=Aurantiacibacter hainanensis TaxID=3076114 RepID=UPI0030C6EDE3